MGEECQLVVFSNRAYNAIIRESFHKDPVETGGILLGHILDNGVWIVMEVLPPGIKCIFERAYFEYDDAFVNYLAQSVANQYETPLDLLGLWHRHPGSMDVFSSTDDGTNKMFAQLNPNGVISGLVNIDPRFRLTIYHLGHTGAGLSGRPMYKRVEIEVGDDIIPEEYFQLRYCNGADSDLNPSIERWQDKNLQRVQSENVADNNTNGNVESSQSENNLPGGNDSTVPKGNDPAWLSDIKEILRLVKRHKLVGLLALVLLVVSALAVKVAYNYGRSAAATVVEWADGIGNKEISISDAEITLEVGSTKVLSAINAQEEQSIAWKSSNKGVAEVDAYGTVKAKKRGVAKITLVVDDKEIGVCKVNVNDKKEKTTITKKSV